MNRATSIIATSIPIALPTLAAAALLSALLLAVTPVALANAPESVAEVTVEPGQTLNEALASIEGAVHVRLPGGVTEHDAPITREATVVIQGLGEGLSTLRAAGDVPLVDQGDLNELFDGDLILSDFTYDRAHQPVRHRPERADQAVIVTNAAGDVIFRNFRVHRFNFDGRFTRFLRGAGPRAHRANEDSARHRYVGFHNATLDFKFDGGIRNRHNSRAGSGAIEFNADRFIFDQHSLFQGHLTQHADPAQTVGDPPAGRGNAGGLGALTFNIWEYGLVDGEIREVDYSVIRYGGVLSRDGVLEIRVYAPDSGFADQFWCRALLEGRNGHLIYDGVVLTSAEGNPWHDRGIYARGDWKTVTVRNSFISGRDAPIDFTNGLRERQGMITITDTTILSRRRGIDIGTKDTILDGVKISNVHIRPHPDNETGFFTEAVRIMEADEGAEATHMVSNVLADGYLNSIVVDRTGPHSTVLTSNLQGRQAEVESRVQGAYPIATIPQRPLTSETASEAAGEFKPIATLEDFNNREGFSRLDMYMTHATEGVYLMVVVGTDGLSNRVEEPRNAYRGDALQFAITHGMPGDHSGYVLFDLARHDERGLHVFRRNLWPDQDLAEGLIDLEASDIEMSVSFDEAAEEVTYKVLFPWEELGLPAPFYDYLSVDLVAAKGDTYPQTAGTTWPSPYPSIDEDDRAKGGGIFHAPTVPTRGFKAVQCE